MVAKSKQAVGAAIYGDMRGGTMNPLLLGPLFSLGGKIIERMFPDPAVAAAAELELNIGTSTVSRHVKDLEIRLGLTLCRRGRAGFALTPEGEKIYAQTTQLMAATEAWGGGSLAEVKRTAEELSPQ